MNILKRSEIINKYIYIYTRYTQISVIASTNELAAVLLDSLCCVGYACVTVVEDTSTYINMFNINQIIAYKIDRTLRTVENTLRAIHILLSL